MSKGHKYSITNKTFVHIYKYIYIVGMDHRVMPMSQRQRCTETTASNLHVKTSRISTLLLSIATFNVLGLSAAEKRYNLAKDCYNYSIDILAIQETKCVQPEDTIIHYIDKNNNTHNYRLIIFEQKYSRHGGLGFIINCKLIDYFKCYEKILENFFPPSHACLIIKYN